MGTGELGLLLKYGMPLAEKLLAADKKKGETIDAVVGAVNNLSDIPDMGEALLNADKDETANIIDGLFGVLAGVGDAVDGLAETLIALMFKGKE